jgi:hypothetical protein
LSLPHASSPQPTQFDDLFLLYCIKCT